MVKPFAPPVQCADCEYVADGKYPARAMTLHRSRVHNTAAAGKQRAKQKFYDLIEATGNYVNASEAGDVLHIWPPSGKPSLTELQAWAEDWELVKEQGTPANLETRVRTVSQQLRAAREYVMWKMSERYARAGIAQADLIIAGKLDAKKQVNTKYVADGVAMTVREISAAFGTPKPTPTQIGKFILNVGDRPPPRQLKKAEQVDQIIEAEVRELPVDRTA